ncbi:MAG: transketolase C-terminal domain-containing protein [Patescibacteria group bacterium]
MINLSFISPSEIEKIKAVVEDKFEFCEFFSDVCRLNTLSMIKEAGSGHMGSSFSSGDIVSWLFLNEMKNPNSENGDTYFSSKGHDVPFLYSVLLGLNMLEWKNVHKLRVLGGLPGHPDIGTPHIMANTGSLGMGISKARGMAIGNRLNKISAQIFVLSGDGELQEGQIWESLQQTANNKMGEIALIVDKNKIQTDGFVENVNNLGNLEEKFRAFGWYVEKCDGHNLMELGEVFKKFNQIKDQPKVLIAETIKGKGVSFMEGTKLAPGNSYKFHSGAPSDEEYEIAKKEILERINLKLKKLNINDLVIEVAAVKPMEKKEGLEHLVKAYGEELLELAKENRDIIALNADLTADCGLSEFKKELPERFIECGIAEQDMVSVAGGAALKGKLPVAHSFVSFLSARPNEQIYNNSSEKRKIIYTGTLAGVLPATPGHSHQGIRDIASLSGIPGLTLVAPANEMEAKLAIRWAVKENAGSSYIRLSSIGVKLPFKFQENHRLSLGRGNYIIESPSKNILIIAYGPIILKEAVLAAQALGEESGLSVMNLPWLNKFDDEWLKKEAGKFQRVLCIDDHYEVGGQGMQLAAMFGNSKINFSYIGFKDFPVCGKNDEILNYYGLDAQGISKLVNNL